MNRFIKLFTHDDTDCLVDIINNYAKENNLMIISIDTNYQQFKAIVLFEEVK